MARQGRRLDGSSPLADDQSNALLMWNRKLTLTLLRDEAGDLVGRSSEAGPRSRNVRRTKTAWRAPYCQTSRSPAQPTPWSWSAAPRAAVVS